LSFPDIFAAGQSHGSPQEIRPEITNGEPGESAKKKPKEIENPDGGLMPHV
jgi:hypothetical protein